MEMKWHRPEDLFAKLQQVDVLVSQGQSVTEAVRAIGVMETVYYRWHEAFSGSNTDHVQRMKDLEVEKQRLRKAMEDPLWK